MAEETPTSTSIQVPESQVEEKILSGAFQYLTGSRVSAINPSGESVNIPAEQAQQALKQGYKIETEKQRAVREYVSENKGIKGQIKTALTQFGDELAFGIPEIIQDKLGNPLEVEKREALKKENEMANAIGGVAGFGASLFVGGPLFKGAAKAGALAEKAVAAGLAKQGITRGSEGLAKNLTARMATNAARLGAEGVVISAPRAITEAALGDPSAAAESLLMGGALGGVLGASGGVFGKAIDKLSIKITKEKTLGFLDDLKNERVAKALGFTKGQIKKLKNGQESAEEIGEHLYQAKLADGRRVVEATGPEELLERMVQFNDEAGSKIGGVYTRLDEIAPNSVDVTSLQKITDDLIQKYTGNLRSSEGRVAQNISDDLKMLVEKNNNSSLVSFSQAKSFMDDIATVAFPKGKFVNPDPRQEVALEAWFGLRNSVDDAAQAAAKKSGDESLFQSLLSARKDYNLSKPAIRALEDKVSSSAGNKLFGLTDTITGVGAATIDPVSAIPAILAKKTFEKYGNVWAADLISKGKEGILFADDYIMKARSRLDEIPAVLKGLERISQPATNSQSTLTAVARLMDDDNLPQDQRIKKMQEKVADLVSNSQMMSDKIAKFSGPLSEGGAPQVAQALNTKLSSMVDYIYKNMPKQNQLSSPFYSPAWKPSDIELAKFERKLSVLIDPLSVFDAIADNSITKDHIEALSINYPSLFQAIKTRIVNYAVDNKMNISYQKRIKLSLLLGYDIDQSLTPQSIAIYQNAFLNPEAQKEDTGLNEQGLMKLGKNISETTATQSQRMQGRI